MMANLRTATPDDVDSLLALAYAMHDESPRFRQYKFMPERLRKNLEAVISISSGFAVVAEQDGMIVGAMVAMSMPHFACDVLQACDLGIFIDEQHRGGTLAARLVRAYMKWAESIGAEPTIGVNTGVHPERTAQLLEALGAKPSGTNYTWGIN